MQIEGSDCHHGADELVGRCLALHQQRREEGQASGDAQVRKSSFNQLQMPWVSQHQRVSLLGREYQPLGRYIQGPAGRVFQYRVGSGPDKIPGSGSGRVG